MKELIGKKITGIRINDDQHYLSFDHPDGTHTTYRAEADCCSETWFSDLLGVSNLLKNTVTSVEEIPMDTLRFYNVKDGRCRQDYDQVYGYALKTAKGDADIIFRNSSNGCYGGETKLDDSKKANIDCKTSIKKDWSA